jgi:cytochrome P450
MSETEVGDGTKAWPIHFDHESSAHARDWPAEFRTLRHKCPRAWSDQHGGFWLATRYADILSIAQRPEAFSTRKDIDTETGKECGGVTIPPVPGYRAIPNEVDPPEWSGFRGFVNRHFSPKAVEQRRVKAQQYAAALVDIVIETGRFDIVDDLTNPLPALVTMEVLGFPVQEWRSFSDPMHMVAYLPTNDSAYAEKVGTFMRYFERRIDEEVALRRTEPKDDLLTHLARDTINGKPLDRHHIHSIALNILGGGVDTTTALTSNALLYLSRNPKEKQRLIDNPELLPIACEEFLRYFSPIHGLARTVAEDIDIDGWHLEKGERVLLAYASANRDPEAFDSPEELKLDRYPNKHIGFGSGIHRCLGSFLARLMFQTMMTEVLSRMPDYEVIEEKILPYTSLAKVNGWIRMPAKFLPGQKVGAVIA